MSRVSTDATGMRAVRGGFETVARIGDESGKPRGSRVRTYK